MVLESFAAALLAGTERNFVKASLEGARRVMFVAVERAWVSSGWEESNAFDTLASVEGR